MNPGLKGISPGKIIAHELKKNNVSQRKFALLIGEHSQTLNAVIKGRRKLTTEMAIKIENALSLEEGFLLTLQVYFDIAQYKKKSEDKKSLGIPKVRKILFWDTDFDKIDWSFNKKAVIRRVLERGNQEEKSEIANFYNLKLEDLKNFIH